MYCTPILIAYPCNDPAINPEWFVERAVRAHLHPPCADHVWTVRSQVMAPDCFSKRRDFGVYRLNLAHTAEQLLVHLEAPWLEAIAAREALAARAELGTPPALTPPAEDTSANPLQPKDRHDP